MQVFAFVFVVYFLLTAGIVYDVIVEPPSMGQAADANGRVRYARSWGACVEAAGACLTQRGAAQAGGVPRVPHQRPVHH
jgi:hypothetical protein